MKRDDEPLTESQLLETALAAVRRAVPPGWLVRTEEAPPTADASVDAMVAIGPETGPDAVFAVEVKRLFRPRDVDYTVERLREWCEQDGRGARPMLVARYLSPSARDRIGQRGGNYLDATGNVSLAAESPMMAVSLDGLDADPWRGPGRPRSGLRGDPAARVVRALIDLPPPYSVPELSVLAGTSTGATYRAVDFLDEEALIEKDGSKIVRVELGKLLRRWSADYGFRRADSVRSYIEPRGPEATLARLTDLDPDEYAITGSFAAQLDAPYAPPRLLTLYLKDIALAEDVLGLRPVDAGNNVLVATMADPWPLDRARTVGGLQYAAVSQVIVDLWDLPGRSPQEADELLAWMERDRD